MQTEPKRSLLCSLFYYQNVKFYFLRIVNIESPTITVCYALLASLAKLKGATEIKVSL